MIFALRDLIPGRLVVFATSLFLMSSCSQTFEKAPTAGSLESPVPSVTPLVESSSVSEEPKEFDEPTKLQYKEFTIEKKLVKKTEGKGTREAEIFDVVISKNGRRVKTIAGDYHPLGNRVLLQLTPLLGGDKKQLIASASADRDARARVVSLDQGVEILFDTREWGIPRSGIEPVDLDGDGVFELISWNWDGYGFCRSYNCFPFIRLIFNFDARSQRFLPANHLFPNEAMKDLPEALAELQRGDTLPTPFARVMMTYLYAGKEAEAWKFFDESAAKGTVPFNESLGKEEIRRNLLGALKTDRFYQYVRKATKITRNK